MLDNSGNKWIRISFISYSSMANLKIVCQKSESSIILMISALFFRDAESPAIIIFDPVGASLSHTSKVSNACFKSSSLWNAR